MTPKVRLRERPIRVALLHNIISPHVIPLFALLSKDPLLELKVYFFAKSEANRRWDSSDILPFRHEILPRLSIRFGRSDIFTYHINYTIVNKLIKDGFDVLLAAGWDSLASQAGFFLARMLRRPYIQWSGSTAYEKSWRRTITLPLVKAMVRGSAACVAYGTRARDYLISLGASPDRVHIAYNTVDVGWFGEQADRIRAQRDEIRRQLGLGPGPVILFVGQLIERKGVRDLVEAYSQVERKRPEAQLLLVGYGPLESELRAYLSTRYPGRARVTGHVPIPDLPRYYVVSDCFVLPSHEEVWGLVLNEAAASGLPLVTTEPVGAGPDLINPGINGFIVPASSPAAIADAVLAALDDSEQMGRASRSIVRKATYQQNVDAIRSAISSTLPGA